MAELAKNFGLELPIFEDDRPLAYSTRSDTISLPPQDEPTMLRRVHIYGNALDALNGITLKQALAHADETFEEVADYCSATVPLHNWGLRRETGETPPEHRDWSGLVPDGYMLLADMEVIDDAEYPDTEQLHQLSRGLREYQYAGKDTYMWRDAKPEQFIKGIGRISLDNTLWLVDIEPCLDKKFSRTVWESLGVHSIDDLHYIAERK